MLLHLLIFLTAQSSDAYAPSTASNNYHMWSSPRLSRGSSSSTSVMAESSTLTTSSSSSSTTSDENITTRDLLSLDYIRSTLIRQEETIIFALIERAQFRQNDIVYKVGGVPGLGVPPGSSGGSPQQSDGEEQQKQHGEEELSFLDFMFIGTVSLFCSLMIQSINQMHFYCSPIYIMLYAVLMQFAGGSPQYRAQV